MKNFIILIIFSFGLSLYSKGELFPFGMNYTVGETWGDSIPEDEEYNQKYKTAMDLTAAAGIKWWRAQYAFRWCDVEPSKDFWKFETEDSLVKWTGERGLNLLPSIGYTAIWARHPNGPSDNEQSKFYPPNPLYWGDYRKYIDTLVKRYKNNIKYWQFSNEPYGSDYFLGKPNQYVEMYESTWVALKNADPTAKIVGLCLTSDDGPFYWKYYNPDSGKITIFEYPSWDTAVRRLIDSIDLDGIDVVSHHIYNSTDNFMKYARELREILKEYTGGENKPIWITETGFQNSDPFRAERGRNENCHSTKYVTYSSDSGEVFQDSVWAEWTYLRPCTTMVDTFLNIGDTVILINRTDWCKDTIIYNGGTLVYKNEDTALAVDDTLTIFDLWAKEYGNTSQTQSSNYAELLDSIFSNTDFLNNLKVFFFCASNIINKHYYPPQIHFGNGQKDTIPAYYRQRLPDVYSVIDTNNKPYPAYSTIKDNILPYYRNLQNITVGIDTTRTFQARDNITAAGSGNFTIEGNGSNGGKVAMEAGEKINLKPGFKVEKGGYFYGSTNPLYGGGMGMSSMKGMAIPNVIKTSEESASGKDSIPTVFSCSRNSPNPFNIKTTIRYGLPKSSKVSLCIYNLVGQKVKTLVDAQQSAGYKSVSWDGKNSIGQEVSQGIYFYVFKAGDFTKNYKMIVVK
jgi:hypothetical protein